jgi:hypothetical protein
MINSLDLANTRAREANAVTWDAAFSSPSRAYLPVDATTVENSSAMTRIICSSARVDLARIESVDCESAAPDVRFGMGRQQPVEIPADNPAQIYILGPGQRQAAIDEWKLCVSAVRANVYEMVAGACARIAVSRSNVCGAIDNFAMLAEAPDRGMLVEDLCARATDAFCKRISSAHGAAIGANASIVVGAALSESLVAYMAGHLDRDDAIWSTKQTKGRLDAAKAAVSAARDMVVVFDRVCEASGIANLEAVDRLLSFDPIRQKMDFVVRRLQSADDSEERSYQECAAVVQMSIEPGDGAITDLVRVVRAQHGVQPVAGNLETPEEAIRRTAALAYRAFSVAHAPGQDQARQHVVSALRLSAVDCKIMLRDRVACARVDDGSYACRLPLSISTSSSINSIVKYVFSRSRLSPVWADAFGRAGPPSVSAQTNGEAISWLLRFYYRCLSVCH